VFVFIYAREAIIKLVSISEEIGDLQRMVDAFSNHLSSVYNLEMFYGDQTLQSLLEHAESFNTQLETFEYIYSLTEEDADQEITADEEQEIDDNKKDEASGN
tara:strand:+ start:6078 stop:6383 length:306 start_codon:yes stop_codon:yes gene_type:complete